MLSTGERRVRFLFAFGLLSVGICTCEDIASNNAERYILDLNIKTTESFTLRALMVTFAQRTPTTFHIWTRNNDAIFTLLAQIRLVPADTGNAPEVIDLNELDYIELNSSMTFGTIFGSVKKLYCDNCTARVSQQDQKENNLYVGGTYLFDGLRFPHRLSIKLCNVSGCPGVKLDYQDPEEISLEMVMAADVDRKLTSDLSTNDLSWNSSLAWNSNVAQPLDSNASLSTNVSNVYLTTNSSSNSDIALNFNVGSVLDTNISSSSGFNFDISESTGFNFNISGSSEYNSNISEWMGFNSNISGSTTASIENSNEAIALNNETMRNSSEVIALNNEMKGNLSEMTGSNNGTMGNLNEVIVLNNRTTENSNEIIASNNGTIGNSSEMIGLNNLTMGNSNEVTVLNNGTMGNSNEIIALNNGTMGNWSEMAALNNGDLRVSTVLSPSVESSVNSTTPPAMIANGSVIVEIPPAVIFSGSNDDTNIDIQPSDSRSQYDNSPNHGNSVQAYQYSDMRELLMGLIAWNVILTILLVIVIVALAVACSTIKRIHRHTRGSYNVAKAAGYDY